MMHRDVRVLLRTRDLRLALGERGRSHSDELNVSTECVLPVDDLSTFCQQSDEWVRRSNGR